MTVNAKSDVRDVGYSIIVNGTISGTGGITLSATNQNISGTGSITSTGTFAVRTGAKTILAGTNLTIAGRITIGTMFASITVTNNGTISSTNTANGITAANAGSTWINAANSTLNVAGPLLPTGILTANANLNTVNYNGTIDQFILSTTYYNLTLDNTGIKTASSNFATNRDLTISLGSNLTINPSVIIQVLGKATTSGLLNNNGQLLISD
jgi:hypothetical protein